MWELLFEQHSALWRYISISRFFVATVNSSHSLQHTLGSASQSAGSPSSFRLSGNTDIKQWAFSREGRSIFQPSGYGGLPSMENAECMEEDTLISLSATPSYESISPEELRWKDYQARQTEASQMSFNVGPSGPSIVPNMCNGDAAPSNRPVLTPNPADHSTPICKFWNNGVSSVSSAGLSSCSFSSIKGTPSTTTSLAEAPSPSFSLFPEATPFPGLHNQSQLALQSPFGLSSAALGLSPGLPSISTMSCPMQASSCVQAQLEKAYCSQWPQSSLQAPILSMPSPLTTITPSPSAASEDQNILPQRDLTATVGENSYTITSGISFNFSNTESGSLVRHGISSLPDVGCKYSHPRTISLLPSKQVFQKTVIRMQSRRHGSLKKDGPRVSFLNDYNDLEDSGKRLTLPVARKNPKEFILGTLWLDSTATQIGAQKEDSIEAM